MVEPYTLIKTSNLISITDQAKNELTRLIALGDIIIPKTNIIRKLIISSLIITT